MGYSKSRPLKSFISEVDEIILVLKKTRLKRNSSLDGIFKNYILASSVFLSHAELENYIQDIFDLYLRSLNNRKFFDLNEDLRSFLVYKFFKDNKIHHSSITNDEKSIITAIKKSSSDGSKHIFDKDLDINYLSGKDIYESYKYPSVKNLQKIYKRIGCESIFETTSKVIKRNAKGILEQIGAHRSSLAHTATLSDLTENDLIIILQDLQLFVKGLDRVIYKKIVFDHKQIFWIENIN